ncbi:MAG: hypothetical protein M1827_004042 [Pycnora praestabilis]|nr:MAG: hypothetical protein M1827_004042 [Pycnora praestabilis]
MDSVPGADASFPIAGPRFKEILSSVMYPFSQNLSSSPPVVPIMDDLLGNFHHFTAPSLPHLLALLTYPLGSFPPPKTSLLVIDSVSTAFSIAYPNSGIQANRLEKQATNNKKDASQWAASRKWAVMGDFVSRMGKLAATKNLAILLTSQTTTKVRINSGAVLTPTLSGTAWENGCANRIVLFRDWIDSQEEDDHSCEMHKARFAGVLKSGGVVHDEYGGFGVIIPFAIESNGLRELLLPEVRTGPHTIPIIPNILKRKREEVGDSQSEDGDLDSDEEYGWAQEDGDATQGLVRDEIIAPD